MICAVVLAAGRSRRMGRQKLLLPFAGRPLIACVIDEVLRSPVDAVFAVVNPEAEAIRAALGDRRVHWVLNPDASGDMLSSVRCGLRALPAELTGALVVLGDQPGVTAELITSMVEAFHARGRGLIVPAFRGRRGHPLLLAARYRQEVLERHDGVGLRGLLQAHAEDLVEADVPEPGVLEDVDVPADYERLRDRYG